MVVYLCINGIKGLISTPARNALVRLFVLNSAIMSVNVDVVRNLAKSLSACILVVVCSSQSMEANDTVAGAVRWASVVTLLAAGYYLLVHTWAHLYLRKRARRLGRSRANFRVFGDTASFETRYERTENVTDLDPAARESGGFRTPSPVDLDLNPLVEEDNSSPHASHVARSPNVYYPELTMGSVWTYVYGWGLLLFVCVYCMAGIDVPASCWWTMGMITLSFDELISKGVKNYWVVVLGGCLGASVFTLWSGSLVDKSGILVGNPMFGSSQTDVLFLDFIMGVVYPVATPFIFFTVRSTVRSVTRDVTSLCEFAMPFMVVLSLCSLVATSGVCGYGKESVGESGKGGATRRLLQETNATSVMVETVAKFASSYATSVHGNTSLMRLVTANSYTLPYCLLFLSPFAVLWLLRVLIVAVLTGHTTEFITSFLLVTSTRYGATHEFNAWSAGAAASAGTALILLLMVRRD